VHGLGLDIESDDLETRGRGVGDQDGNTLVVGWCGKFPTDRVARELVVTDQRDAAEPRTLQVGVGHSHTVDPQAALGVDVIDKIAFLNLCGIEFFEVRLVTAQLPREMLDARIAGTGSPARRRGRLSDAFRRADRFRPPRCAAPTSCGD
jgi:hypothetical protein